MSSRLPDIEYDLVVGSIDDFSDKASLESAYNEASEENRDERLYIYGFALAPWYDTTTAIKLGLGHAFLAGWNRENCVYLLRRLT